MDETRTVGVDLAKQVFLSLGATSDGRAGFRKKLSGSQSAKVRSALPPCIVAVEACAAAHYSDRELARLGDDIRLIPPVCFRPFVRRRNSTSDLPPDGHGGSPRQRRRNDTRSSDTNDRSG
ncbi:hypothetical protein SAMN04488105_10769 [Salipiger thiooxidans]|uniref:Transposase n=1 Tax=Salipiger thiooxidans TaxID=282683 RepID=A0A1G7FGZ2_9RHOB|nr:hypothetical protein SAMN04488105_10769 [Salipiger thiooxidans]